jgi:hypothetical protein
LFESCTRLHRAIGDRLTVTRQPAGLTANELAGANASQIDGWLVPQPWPAIVDDARQRAGLPSVLARTSKVLAHSPLQFYVWNDRAAVLAPRCSGGRVGWKCLGDGAGTPWPALGGQALWGTVKPGHGDAIQGAGLLAIGQATAAYFGRTDISATDLDDDGFRAWFARLERAVPTFAPPEGSPAQAMVVQGPSAFDAAVALEVEIRPLLAQSPARASQLRVVDATPATDAEVVFVSPRDARHAAGLRAIVTGATGRRALVAAGWRAGGISGARPRIDAGTLAALRDIWRSVTGH